MSLLWLILKIILWILLVIIGVIGLLIVLILTLPIDYCAEFEKINEIVFKTKVRIFYIATMQFGYTEENSDFIIKVFGRQINKRTKHIEQEEIKQEAEKKVEKETKKEVKRERKQEVKQEVKPEISNTFEEKKVNNKEFSRVDVTSRKPDKKTEKTSKKQVPIREESIKDQSNNFRELWANIKMLWQDEYRKGFTRGTKRLIVDLFSELKPDSIYFNLLIGRENPADTGELLALITMLYPLYARYGVIQADFEEEGIWGEVKARGRLRLYRLIKPFVVFGLNKSVRNYVKIILNIRKDDSNGVSIK